MLNVMRYGLLPEPGSDIATLSRQGRRNLHWKVDRVEIPEY